MKQREEAFYNYLRLIQLFPFSQKKKGIRNTIILSKSVIKAESVTSDITFKHSAELSI